MKFEKVDEAKSATGVLDDTLILFYRDAFVDIMEFIYIRTGHASIIVGCFFGEFNGLF